MFGEMSSKNVHYKLKNRKQRESFRSFICAGERWTVIETSYSEGLNTGEEVKGEERRREERRRKERRGGVIIELLLNTRLLGWNRNDPRADSFYDFI